MLILFKATFNKYSCLWRERFSKPFSSNEHLHHAYLIFPPLLRCSIVCCSEQSTMVYLLPSTFQSQWMPCCKPSLFHCPHQLVAEWIPQIVSFGIIGGGDVCGCFTDSRCVKGRGVFCCSDQQIDDRHTKKNDCYADNKRYACATGLQDCVRSSLSLSQLIPLLTRILVRAMSLGLKSDEFNHRRGGIGFGRRC